MIEGVIEGMIEGVIEQKRVLLVEDSENDAALALAAFEETSLANEVAVVRDGQEALDYLYRQGAYADRPEGHPAVVLLDLKLPRLSGLQVLERIKGDAALRVIPVVMLSSSGQASDLARSYGLGANGYVVKPVGFPEFTTALRQLGLFWTAINEPPPGAVAKATRY